MGFFKRVIGKIAGSDLVRRVIGKAAGHISKVIGKAEHHYSFAKIHPELGQVLDAAENTQIGQKIKGAIRQVKKRVGEAVDYGNDTTDKRSTLRHMGGMAVD